MESQYFSLYNEDSRQVVFPERPWTWLWIEGIFIESADQRLRHVKVLIDVGGGETTPPLMGWTRAWQPWRTAGYTRDMSALMTNDCVLPIAVPDPRPPPGFQPGFNLKVLPRGFLVINVEVTADI